MHFFQRWCHGNSARLLADKGIPQTWMATSNGRIVVEFATNDVRQSAGTMMNTMLHFSNMIQITIGWWDKIIQNGQWNLEKYCGTANVHADCRYSTQMKWCWNQEHYDDITINTLRLEWIGQHFADSILKWFLWVKHFLFWFKYEEKTKKMIQLVILLILCIFIKLQF